MTEQEALHEIMEASVMALSDKKKFESAMRVAINALEEIQRYRAIGTVEECREAREKQVPKKPNLEGDGCDSEGNIIYDTWICPNCGKDYEVDYDEYDYCPNCGQAIDWSEEE